MHRVLEFSPATKLTVFCDSEKRFFFRNLFVRRTMFPAIFAAICVFIVIGAFLEKDHYLLFGSTTSRNAFVYLASSFLQGRLDLDPGCPCLDLSPFHGKVYAMWPPLCAFLLIPFVYLHGICIGYKWINVFLVAISAAFGWLMIDVIGHRFSWKISLWYKILLTIFLGCGTSFLILSLAGNHHYYMAQVAATAMMMIALFFLFSAPDHPWQYLISGTFWGLAILSRMHLILAAPVFLYVPLFGMSRYPDIETLKTKWGGRLKSILAVLSPVLLAVIFLGWYNWARFGSIFDCGISYHLMNAKFEQDYRTYGYINPHYFWNNVYYTLIKIPLFPHLPWFVEPNPTADLAEGFSIFFQSPPLLYALNSSKLLKTDGLVASLWLSIISVGTVILCLMGTGWEQWGARYLFDLFSMLFPLLVIGSRGKITPFLVLLVTASVLTNMCGLLFFHVIKLS